MENSIHCQAKTCLSDRQARWLAFEAELKVKDGHGQQ
jgi:hypothetical protein